MLTYTGVAVAGLEMNSHSHAVESWHNQFILTRGVSDGPKGWLSTSLGEWHLHTHESLPVLPVRDGNGRKLGWLLGWPISLDSERILKPSDDFRLGEDEEQLYEMGGRWLALVVGRSKVYGDPTCSISTVYMPEAGIVASTTGLLPPGKPDPDHARLAATLDIPRKDNWYPFGLTAHPQARRLHPNQVLDLDTFGIRRIWPGPIPAEPVEPGPAIDRIIEIARAQLRAITREFEFKGNITAGYDTRTILALARPYASSFRFITRNNGRFRDAVDANTAKQIASAHDLDLTIVGERVASQAELDAWQERTGHCIAGAVWRSVATWKGFEPGRSNVTGIFPAFKGFYRTEEPLDRLSGSLLLSLLRLPSDPMAERAAERWLSEVRSIPGISKRQLLDIMQIEQRSGGWGAPTLYGNEDTAPPFWLLSQREIIGLMLRMPGEYIESKKLPQDIIAKTWPELLAYNVNAPSGLAGLGLYFYGAYRLARSKLLGLLSR